MKNKKPDIEGLIEIVKKLRDPNGCPWDREQTHETLKPYLIEEAYETLEAIDDKDPEKLCEELGDILLHIVMHSEMAREDNEFNLSEVVEVIKEKMIRRHPHIFAKAKVKGVEDVWKNWEKIKKQENRKKGTGKTTIDNVPKALPSLYRADKVQERASRVGFDWNNVAKAWKKVDEERKEIEELIFEKGDLRRIREEIGDLLFAIVNVSRKLLIDAEESLRDSTSKFINRFKKMEELIDKDGKNMRKLSLKQLDQYWDKIKSKEKK